MHLGTILVHLDHSKRCAARVGLAARLARTHDSHLVGLVPTGLYDGVIPADAIPTGASDFIAESAEYLRQRAEIITRGFKDRIAGPGPLSYEVRLVDGESVDAVVHHGRASDLIIVGQTGREAPGDIVARSLPQQVMLRSGRPVLIVPGAGDFPEIGRNVLVAWDGTRESAVALRDALRLLDKTSRVTLVSLRKANEPEDLGRLYLAQTIDWLLRYGIRATARQYMTTIGVADSLLSCAASMGADLVVMGGYGHTRVRELVIGGVTHEILAHMTVPVLMAH
jgi:nucleotide-binding universal stress UspA family protein